MNISLGCHYIVDIGSGSDAKPRRGVDIKVVKAGDGKTFPKAGQTVGPASLLLIDYWFTCSCVGQCALHRNFNKRG